jgi:hypothetical protein
MPLTLTDCLPAFYPDKSPRHPCEVIQNTALAAMLITAGIGKNSSTFSRLAMNSHKHLSNDKLATSKQAKEELATFC